MIIIAENDNELSFLAMYSEKLQGLAQEHNITIKAASVIKLFENGSCGPSDSPTLVLKVRNGGYKQNIAISDIVYIRHIDRTAYLYLKDEVVEAYISMKKLVDILGAYGFIMVHRNYLVPVKNIKKINYYNLALQDETVIPIGRTYREQLAKYNLK